MKHIFRLAMLIVAMSLTAAADTIRLDPSTPQAGSTLNLLAPPVKSFFAPNEFMSSAAGRSFEFQGDGYIGTVRDFDGINLTDPTPQTETAVPEPATIVLVGTGMIAAWRRRKYSTI
jgi:hypothetical protein